MGGGYVKTHRDAMEHAVFQDPWLWKVFSWCVMRANFKTTSDLAPRGSFTTGRIKAADELRMSPSRVYRIFKRLEKLGSIIVKSNSQFTTVTVCNYGIYQGDDSEVEQRLNNERTADEQPADTVIRREEGKKGRSKKPGVSLQDCLKTCEQVHIEISPVWHQWMTYKHEKNQRFTETGLQAAVTHLANMIASHGVQAVASAILKAMASGYQGWDNDGAFPKHLKSASFAPPPQNAPVPTKTGKGVDWSNAAAP